jgi:hypothetical protein
LGALHKAWKGYVIAKNKDEYDKMLHYADIIQECQDDLGKVQYNEVDKLTDDNAYRENFTHDYH